MNEQGRKSIHRLMGAAVAIVVVLLAVGLYSALR